MTKNEKFYFLYHSFAKGHVLCQHFGEYKDYEKADNEFNKNYQQILRENKDIVSIIWLLKEEDYHALKKSLNELK